MTTQIVIAALIGLVGPDLSLVGGFRPDLAPGQLAARNVPLYNALHALPGPLVLLALGVALTSAPVLAAAGAWLVHVAADRSLGYGLRTADGLQRG